MQYTYFKAFKPLFFIISALIIAGSASAQTQPVATPAAPAAAAAPGVQTHIDKFFKEYDKQTTARAIIDIFKTNKTIPKVIENEVLKALSFYPELTPSPAPQPTV